MSTISQKRDAYKIQIRRKRVQQKISQLRAAYMEKLQQDIEDYTDEQIQNTINQALFSKEKLLENIQAVRKASFSLNQKNAHLFFPLISEYCYVLANLQSLFQNKQTKEKHKIYNQILTLLINVSSNEAYQWPAGQYLTMIKNIVVRQREINTMWFLSNILYQRHNQETQEKLTRQLIGCDCLSFCNLRLKKQFQNQQDINVFTCFITSFLTNSVYLTFEQFKLVLQIITNLSNKNSDSIDWFIADSMIDHAPYLAAMNYELLYTGIIQNFKERYIKKKKTKMVLKFLQFVKTYIFTEIQQNIQLQNQEEFKDNKLAKNNYERISKIILPILNLCVTNLSPQVKANLMEIGCLLLDFYFSFIDLENQSFFMTLAEGLNKNAVSILNKYSGKALYWQLRLFHILLNKIHEYKISTQIINPFVEENKIMEAISIILKEKVQVLQIVQEIAELMVILLSQVDFKNEAESVQESINEIRHTFESILNSNQVNDERLYKKIEQAINFCEDKI